MKPYTLQYTFPRPTTVTHEYPDGRTERVRYGHFESVMYTHINDRILEQTVTLAVPYIPVTCITCENGTKIIFDQTPFYTNRS